LETWKRRCDRVMGRSLDRLKKAEGGKAAKNLETEADLTALSRGLKRKGQKRYTCARIDGAGENDG